MYRIFHIVSCILLLAGNAYAQSSRLQCRVIDGHGKPVEMATVALLKPADSTLAYFGISNQSGAVEIKNVNDGVYLVQVALVGYKTFYKQAKVPVLNNDLGLVIMDKLSQQMDEVVITGERIPLLIKKDTVEYDARAFKTKPDANVEELLNKLPGVEVDRSGNIKAQGEQVNKLFVDGKEFFGNDPKVATRNLPADAISKVQVFDKKSDMTEFTGVDDGSRERTINLMLKDGKKQGYFGDATVGGGTNERYKAAAKLYRFRPQSQFAALGMLNNINRSGFSFSDYINFSGGLQSMMNGGNFLMEINGGNNLPVNFGQPVNGIVTSGAAGINYSYEMGRNRRISVSYMGNGADKKLNETTWSRNFTQQNDFVTEGNSRQQTKNITHRLNLNVRNDMDSFTQVTLYAGGELSDNHFRDGGSSSSRMSDLLVNTQDRNVLQLANSFTARGGGGATRRSASGKDVFNLSGSIAYQQNLKEDDWNNVTVFTGIGTPVANNLFRNDRVRTQEYDGGFSWSHALGKGYFVEPQLKTGANLARLNREQGTSPDEGLVIDSLSPDFKTNYTYLRPGISIKKGTSRVQYNLSLHHESGFLAQRCAYAMEGTRNYNYFLPGFNWRNEYATGKHLSFNYSTSVQAPDYNQLLSVPVIVSPLSATAGNSMLQPEYNHIARAAWMLFDQFSLTSLFVSINGSYTRNKINRSVTINNSLAQYSSLVNVPDDYTAGMSISFDRPVGALGIKLKTGVNERYNKGYTLVNGVSNATTSLVHEWTIGVENRKKEKWDAEIGGIISITDARYSLQQSLNNVYSNIGGYATLSYRPGSHWYFLLSADVTLYGRQSFNSSVLVPLLRSEVSYYFLKGKRGVLTLEGFDLLNGNTYLQRVSNQNYLAEVRSDIVGQYFMLSFKYILNKTGKKSPGMLDDIDIRVR